MTIAEIESTLRTLRTRHQNLDEELLITLLTAGGWEEKVIKDAVSIFKSSLGRTTTSTTNNVVDVVLPLEQKKEVIQEEVSEMNRGKEEKVGSTLSQNQVVSKITEVDQQNKVDIPHTESHQESTMQTLPDITYYTPSGEEEVSVLVLPEVATPNIRREEKVVIPQESVVIPPKKVKETIAVLDLSEKNNTPVTKVSENVPVKAIEVEPKLVVSSVTPSNETLITTSSQQKEILTPQTLEPQSLILPKEENRVLSPEIVPPENLPLKPFDSTPHIWPFSKYKEVFHGETMASHQEEAVDASLGIASHEHSNHEHVGKKLKIKRTGFDGEDEGLIFLTGTTLLIILLLLAYMYSNGRI